MKNNILLSIFMLLTSFGMSSAKSFNAPVGAIVDVEYGQII